MNIRKETVYFVDHHSYEYMRLGPNNWWVFMGSSWEPEFLDESVLEMEFQAAHPVDTSEI